MQLAFSAMVKHGRPTLAGAASIRIFIISQYHDIVNVKYQINLIIQAGRAAFPGQAVTAAPALGAGRWAYGRERYPRRGKRTPGQGGRVTPENSAKIKKVWFIGEDGD